MHPFQRSIATCTRLYLQCEAILCRTRGLATNHEIAYLAGQRRALPPRFPSTITWRDPFTGRHAVPYPTTREWNSGSTRTWGRPPLRIDALVSLLKAMVCPHLPSARPHWIPSLAWPTVAPTQSQLQFKPGLFHSPSDDDVLLFSDGSKSRGRVGAAFVHLHPATGSIIGPHLIPLPSYMSVFDAELYAASCALQYAAGLPHSTSASTARRP